MKTINFTRIVFSLCIPVFVFAGCNLGIGPVATNSDVEIPIPNCTYQNEIFSGGRGSISNPYRIATRADLEAIVINYLGCYFILTQDIDLGGAGNPFTPISGGFSGNFDGNNHTISNLYFSNNLIDEVGLFKSVGIGGLIKNLTVSNINITAREYAGAIAATTNGATIQNCRSTGTITIGTSTSGGLVGYAVASTFTSVSSSVSHAGFTGYDVGGLVGNLSASTISDSYATGSTSADSNAGGLVGSAINGSTITRSYATGIAQNGNFYSGGLVGVLNASTVSLSYATGNATAGGGLGDYTGGFVGSATNSTISNCYARGSSGLTNSVSGGFVGSATGSTFVNSYSSGAPSSLGVIGGFAGVNGGGNSVTTCYWNQTTAGTAVSALGTARTNAQMIAFANYIGWDFATIWNGAGYGGSAAVMAFLR